MDNFKIVQFEPTRVAGFAISVKMTDVATANPIPGFWGQLFEDGRYGKLNGLTDG